MGEKLHKVKVDTMSRDKINDMYEEGVQEGKTKMAPIDKAQR